MTNKFRGTGVALVTPFNKDLSVDFQALAKLLEFTAQYADYWVVMGTTGESATLSKEEKQSIRSFVVENNPKKLPIVYGIGGNNTAEVLENIQNTDFTGIDAILSVSPYYNKPSQEGIYRHYTAIADQSPVPVILYNVPGRTASNICASTTLRLADHPNIIGTKEACGNLEQIMQIAKDMPADFLLISGDDMLAVPMMTLGACGVISVLANAFPQKFAQMINAGLEGNFEQARQLIFEFTDINPLMYEEGNPVGVKAALALQGICAADVRLPLVQASQSLTDRIAATSILASEFRKETVF